MTNFHQTARIRVMIVDPGWQFGLELADCLATSGYQAVLVRNLESMIDDLGELQPGAILLHADSHDRHLADQGNDTLQAVKALCPQAPVLTLTKPEQDTVTKARAKHLALATHPIDIPSNRVEDLLRTQLGIPCARLL